MTTLTLTDADLARFRAKAIRARDQHPDTYPPVLLSPLQLLALLDRIDELEAERELMLDHFESLGFGREVVR